MLPVLLTGLVIPPPIAVIAPAALVARAPVARAPAPLALAMRDSRSRDRAARLAFRNAARACHPDVAGGSVAAFQARVAEFETAQKRARTVDDINVVIAAAACLWCFFGLPLPDPLVTLATVVGVAVVLDSPVAESNERRRTTPLLHTVKTAARFGCMRAHDNTPLLITAAPPSPPAPSPAAAALATASALRMTSFAGKAVTELSAPSSTTQPNGTALKHTLVDIGRRSASFWDSMKGYQTVWEKRAVAR